MSIIWLQLNDSESFQNLVLNLLVSKDSTRDELLSLLKQKNHYVKQKTDFFRKVLTKIYWYDSKLCDVDTFLKNKNLNIQKDLKLLMFAYEFARLKHLKQTRKDWSLYFWHSFQVANIVLDEYDKTDINTLIICLLHDVWEDVLRDYLQDDQIFSLLEKIFWKHIAFWLSLMTKDSKIPDWLNVYDENISRQKRDERYFERINKQLRKFKKLSKKKQEILLAVIRSKSADRLHNLRDIKAVSKDFVNRKITETKENLLPIVIVWDKKSYELLVDQINELESL